jgi:hypothetical protein
VRKSVMRYILDSAVISSPGQYRYELIAVEEARVWIHTGPWQSHVGYPRTVAHIRRSRRG